MKKKFGFILLNLIFVSLVSCKTSNSLPVSNNSSSESNSSNTSSITLPSISEDDKNTLMITYVEGSNNCWSFNEQILTFSNINMDTIISLTGDFNGQIVIDISEEFKFELELNGVNIYSSKYNPINIISGNKVTITAKKDSVNYIYDNREAISTSDEISPSSSIYATCDLNLGGKGELNVISANNNGIHTKDDLKIKNLTLSVTCLDNALKGNDNVLIESGAITLIAKKGDGIKTSNSNISSKGNQRGNVTISGGTIYIYAACDGIDASYNISIENEAILNIYTDRYSEYSSIVEVTDSKRYIRASNNNYSYSIKYYNDDNDYKFVNASFYKLVNERRNYYYYTFEKNDNYKLFQMFVYEANQTQGQEDNYVYKTDYLTWNDAFDTFVLESRGGSFTYNYSNYSTSNNMDRPNGGMNDGNNEKGEYSTKGLKADNEIVISGGNINIKSYDDCIHANGDVTFENGSTSLGNITVSNGNLTLFSKDDALHADNLLSISGGVIEISESYEGLEGKFVNITGGEISIVSKDDGINATTTEGQGIIFNGGKVYVYAGGDGIDSNSRTRYQGIMFLNGEIVIVSTSGGNSSIDTENGYTYENGKVLALCPMNGMGQESTNCSNFSSIASKTTMNLTKGQTLNVNDNNETLISCLMPCNLSSLVIYLGSSSVKFVVN